MGFFFFPLKWLQSSLLPKSAPSPPLPMPIRVTAEAPEHLHNVPTCIPPLPHPSRTSPPAASSSSSAGVTPWVTAADTESKELQFHYLQTRAAFPSCCSGARGAGSRCCCFLLLITNTQAPRSRQRTKKKGVLESYGRAMNDRQYVRRWLDLLNIYLHVSNT